MLTLNRYGWDASKEGLHDLTAFTQARRCQAPVSVPDSLDPDWTQDDQGPWPFCHAHMRTGMEELLALLAGQPLQFSRAYASIKDMAKDGDASVPAGASISGSLRSALEDGAALEETMPYFPMPSSSDWNNIDRWCNQHYSPSIPDMAIASSKFHRIKSLTPQIRSYKEMDALMVTGRYVIGFGLTWTQGLSSIRDETFPYQYAGGQVLGGHAVLAFGWKTIRGQRWYALHNSHNQWGVRRRCYMSPAWWDYTLQTSQFGAWGASDIALDDPKPLPRDFSFAKPRIVL